MKRTILNQLHKEEKKSSKALLIECMPTTAMFFNEAKPVINIAYTKEIRTLQTSDAFLTELKTKINEPVVSSAINDTTLRFYDLSPAYTNFKDNGNWMQYLQQLKDSLHYNELANEIAQLFFTPAFFKSLNKKSKDKFTTDLYGFITIFYSMQKEVIAAGYSIAEVDMQPFLTCQQLAILGDIDNAEDYLEKGPATNADGIQIKIAVPLLADFVKTTDAFIKTKNVNAQLRFSHAETISPYATLLGFTTTIEATKNTTSIINLWRADKTIPLSSNIQWIIYQKKGEEKYLVKFLLNEKEMAVKGLTTKTFPYYNWNDVRAFYIKKLNSFNASLDTDYIKYLNEVK
ncbi:MAG: histidine-type phosphatase [Ferruginibacter sp.]